MSTRDELANRVRDYFDDHADQERAEMLADALIAEGWRKMPSAEEVEAVVQRHWEAWTGRESQDFSTIVATSILALMDGGQ